MSSSHTHGRQTLTLTRACASTPTWASWTTRRSHRSRSRSTPNSAWASSRCCIIIDECTAEHVNLLESLIGKVVHRLLQLPGVLGVRVKIAKLEIFDDCEVAIRMEAGEW
jgi:hypothetical protein